MLFHFDVQEDNDARDVIHNVVFLLFPPKVRLSHYSLGCFFCILTIEEGQNDLCYVVVAEELPHAIRRKHDESVVWAEVELEDLRLSGDTDSRSHLVTKGPSHGQARNVLTL